MSCLQPWTWIARLNIVWGIFTLNPWGADLNSTGCHLYSTNSLRLLSFSNLKETCCCPFLSDFMIKLFIYHHPGLCPTSSMFLHRMLLPFGGRGALLYVQCEMIMVFTHYPWVGLPLSMGQVKMHYTHIPKFLLESSTNPHPSVNC